MSFKSINDILKVLEAQPEWQEQPFSRVLKCWSEVVGAVMAAHTRPLSIQRDVLRVATSSAAWAQNLTFERQRLLLKLNQKLSIGLRDIHFSTAGWQRPQETPKEEQAISLREHPSYIGDVINVGHDVTDITATSEDANAAFQHWARKIAARSQDLPLCPKCQCPTPPGELRRWGVCTVCAAQQFSNS
ncbi:RNA-binding protein [Nostocales cyanobacterium HT-58-2]|nr:RNA-binding protein [Nostocales cyanobacterium HT-58-2]